MEERKSTITKEQLIEFGMVEDLTNPIHPMRKVISIKDENSDEDDGELSIVIDMTRNVSLLALLLPDGATLFLDIGDIETLKMFENCIASYEPNF